MAHYLPESPNNGVAQTYMLIASRHGQTYGASRGGGGGGGGGVFIFSFCWVDGNYEAELHKYDH